MKSTTLSFRGPLFVGQATLWQMQSMHMSQDKRPTFLPPPPAWKFRRADTEESDLNELAWILPRPSCSSATGSARPVRSSTADAEAGQHSALWWWTQPKPAGLKAPGAKDNHGSMDIELSDLDHTAEEIPYHIATSCFFCMLRGCFFLSLTI